MSITKENWGFRDGLPVSLLTIKNNFMSVKLTNFGAAIAGIIMPDKLGSNADIVLGYDNLDGYVKGASFQGAVVGRYANRIGAAAFNLNGKTYRLTKNDGDNSLHGGSFGFNRRVWKFSSDSSQNIVIFKYHSHDGEEGYPGALDVSVKYTLTNKNKLKIKYSARSTRDTIFNPTNHAYFNLRSSGPVYDTLLQIKAVNYTPFDEFNIPTGDIEPVFNTPFNFTKPKRIGDALESDMLGNYDHNFLLGEAGEMKKAAVAHDRASGRIMAVFTDMPAIQLYTAGGLSEYGKGGQYYGKHHAFCLETQYTPNTPNLAHFPQCVLRKGRKFKSTTVYAFGIK